MHWMFPLASYYIGILFSLGAQINLEIISKLVRKYINQKITLIMLEIVLINLKSKYNNYHIINWITSNRK